MLATANKSGGNFIGNPRNKDMSQYDPYFLEALGRGNGDPGEWAKKFDQNR